MLGEAFLLFALTFIRYLYFGFKYYPQLDDYIQYSVYRSELSVSELINNVGILGARPLAGLFDYYIWSSFWGNMIFALIIITLLTVIGAIILKNFFSEYLKCGWIFLVFICLIPSNFESIYWISASSRISVGFFFACLSAFFFNRWLHQGKLKNAIFYWLFQLISFGFYEQILVFSAAVSILLAFLNLKRLKYALLSLVSLLNTGIYFMFVSLFANSAVYGERTKIVLPVSKYYFTEFLPEVLSQVKSSVFGAALNISINGFINGIKQIVNDKAYIYLLFVAVLIFAFTVIRTNNGKCKREYKSKPWYFQLIIGLILTIAPLAPYFVADNIWVSIRAAFLPYIGIALILELIFDAVFGKCKSRKIIYTTVCSIAIAVCLIASVSELYDYKETTEYDSNVVEELGKTLGPEQEALDVCVLNLNSTDAYYKNYQWHEHIHGITESEWALYGAYKSYFYNHDESLHLPNTIVPISIEGNEIYRAWNYDNYHILRFDYIYYYDNEKDSLSELKLSFIGKNGEKKYLLSFTDSGEDFAIITENEKVGTIELIN